MVSKETRLILTLIFTSVLGYGLHLTANYLLGTQEKMFYLIFFVSSVGFAVMLLRALYSYHTSGQPGDLWMVGYLGLLGLVGLFPQVDKDVFGFFGFFGLFSLKGKHKKEEIE